MYATALKNQRCILIVDYITPVAKRSKQTKYQRYNKILVSSRTKILQLIL